MQMKNDYFNEECLYVYNKFGETVVQNVCTYKDVNVSWGFWNWFNFIIVIIAMASVLKEISGIIEEMKEGK